MLTLTDALRAEYRQLFADCHVQPAEKGLVEQTAQTLARDDHRSAYQRVAAETGVPWYVVGILHLLECDLDFERHLHNGDPLSGYTTHAPRGRPQGQGSPPFAFERSAADALSIEGFTGWGDWSLAGCLYRLEVYNGLGYRLFHPQVNSPYLWSFTDRYEKGKYGADGKFDPDLVSRQVGAAAVLRAMYDREIVELPEPPEFAFALAAEAPLLLYPGRVLRAGDPDRGLVRTIQQRLVEVGCGPLDVDGLFGSATASAVRLFQSRMVDRSGRTMPIDGVVGPLSWEALFGAATVRTQQPSDATDPLLARALAVAESQIGVREAPPNSNRGAEVDAYVRAVGVPLGSPWCAAFVYWCFAGAASQLGVDNPVVESGGCMDHWRRARAQGVRSFTGPQAQDDPSLVQPGHIFIMDHGGGLGHTGLVKRVQGGLLDTIEGNTNVLGSRQGDGVYEKERRVDEITGGFLDYSTHRLTCPERSATSK